MSPTGSFAGFSGNLILLDAGTFRFDQGANTWGGAQIAFNLGNAGIINNHSDTVAAVYLGSLTGGSSSRLAASDQSGTFTDTYIVGDRNMDSTFSGCITNGTGTPTAHSVAITKTGTGTLSFR